MNKEPLRKLEETARTAVLSALSSKTDLLFVYDVLSCKGKFPLKFVSDAGRYPLSDLEDTEFEYVYGLPKRLEFKQAEPRSYTKQDWWTSLYS